jgi:hypothetical protein
VVGEPYDREFGERQSSIRRGAQFERNAYAGDARLLREAFAGPLGKDPEAVIVRNLMDDHPGTKQDARIARLRSTRTILAQASAGRPPADIVIQPQLLIPTRPGSRPFFFIAPDVLVWWPDSSVYLPADLKSFIVRENEVAKADLARARLQLGGAGARFGSRVRSHRPNSRGARQGLLVFSRPNGLRPHAPRIEDIGGAVEAIRIGIAAFLRHRARIDELRAGAEPFTVVADLTPHFQDGCLAFCVMAQSQWCRGRIAGKAADMGDVASDVLGDISIDRALALLNGAAEPETDHERIVAEQRHLLLRQHDEDAAA